MKTKNLDWITRVLMALCMAALGVGMVLQVSKTRKSAPVAAVAPVDPARAVYDEGLGILTGKFPEVSGGAFSDYSTDSNTGAAELGGEIWEAWGRIDAAGGRTDWHVAWDRKTGRVIYWKVGNRETGNYAEALEASKAYPAGHEPD